MSKVKVRVVLEETLIYDQVVEMDRKEFEELKEGIPFTEDAILEALDLTDVVCPHRQIQHFEVVGGKA